MLDLRKYNRETDEEKKLYFDLVIINDFNDIKSCHPAWQVVHISRSVHILDIIQAICQLPGVDVVDHGAEGFGVHGVDVDLSLPGLPHVGVQHGTEDWRLGAEEIFVNSECL